MKRTLVCSKRAETRRSGDLFDLSWECAHQAAQMCTDDRKHCRCCVCVRVCVSVNKMENQSRRLEVQVVNLGWLLQGHKGNWILVLFHCVLDVGVSHTSCVCVICVLF